MENTRHNSFEEQWQNAFDDASLPPSEAVWERIESNLENNIPPKPNNNFTYYFGFITTIILGVGLWFFMSENEVKKEVQVIENEIITPIEKVLPKEVKPIIKSKEKALIKRVFIPEREEIIEPEIVVNEPENQERIISDSIDFMNPIMATKKVNSELENPSINIPFERTPYYEIPKPKSKKNSIWDKIRISGGIGVYQ